MLTTCRGVKNSASWAEPSDPSVTGSEPQRLAHRRLQWLWKDDRDNHVGNRLNNMRVLRTGSGCVKKSTRWSEMSRRTYFFSRLLLSPNLLTEYLLTDHMLPFERPLSPNLSGEEQAERKPQEKMRRKKKVYLTSLSK